MSRLLVLGNAGLDVGLMLPGLPRRGETLVGASGGRAPGGKGLNQAAVAARTGLVPVLFQAPVGDDPEGREVARHAAAEPFAELALPVLGRPTDLSVLLLLPDRENAIVSAGDCAHAVTPADAAAFGARCGAGDWLLLQGNLRPEATAAAARAAAAGRVILNAAPCEPGVETALPFCHVVVANAVEAEQLPAHPAPISIVTLGAAGCRVTSAEGVRHVPAEPVVAIDTTGAGDAFCGVLAATLAAGWALPAAIRVAARAAAQTVTRPGAFHALPSAAELAALLA